MSLEGAERRAFSTAARLGELLIEGERSEFWQEVARYMERRRAEIREEGFSGDPEELATHQARENELAQFVEWIATAKEEGIEGAKALEKDRGEHGEG